MGIKGAESDGEDPVAHMFVSSSHDDLLCFTDTGRVFLVKVWQVPEASRTGRGRAIVNLLALKEGEKVRTLLPVHDFEANENYLVFASEQGKVKRTSLKDYRNVNRSGIIAIGLNEGDRLMGVLETTGSDHLLLATRKGMAIRFHEDDARVMGRAAAGVRGIDLDDDDALVGCVRCVDGADLLTATANGYGKRTGLGEYLVQCDDGSTRVQDRGGKGRKDIQTSGRNGPVVAVRAVTDADDLLFISEGGKVVRTHARDVSRIGRNTQGVRLVRLKEGDSLAAVSVAPFVEGAAEAMPDGD
jgi:DNA gyrase subunit A